MRSSRCLHSWFYSFNKGTAVRSAHFNINWVFFFGVFREFIFNVFITYFCSELCVIIKLGFNEEWAKLHFLISTPYRKLIRQVYIVNTKLWIIGKLATLCVFDELWINYSAFCIIYMSTEQSEVLPKVSIVLSK